ncbi:(2Fe-2S)-binding protein [Salinicoccus bachuensis]|uniref:(2Fe-2S)-binding protein n=1 Tax=Salinicoccus bachuensis TaxID=3136731 RepID=A0ABZ3CKC8_9STAP
MTRRIIHHKILGSMETELVPFFWNGRELHGHRGESISAALLANDIRTLRNHEKDGRPRGLYCNIGHCSECRVTINGRRNQRACLNTLDENMRIEAQDALSHLTERGRADA